MPPGIVGTSFLFCVSARLLGPDSTSEIYGPATLPDRRSVGIESETTQTGIDWGAPRVPPRLREARRSRVGESDQFRPLPSPARLAGNDTLHANCRTKNISSARQFQRRASPIGDGQRASIDHAAGAAAVGMFYGCGQHDKRSCVAAFQLSRRQRKHNLPDQLRVHPRSDRN
jgi:hypothetical protein